MSTETQQDVTVDRRDMHGKLPFDRARASPFEVRSHDSDETVLAFLKANVSEFDKYVQICEWNWNTSSSKTHINKMHNGAQKAGLKPEARFCDDMRSHASYLHKTLQAFNKPSSVPEGMCFKVLDIGAAPGGFAEAVIRNNPGCQITCLTLAPSVGGHRMILKAEHARCHFVDITSLAGDLGTSALPVSSWGASQAQQYFFQPFLKSSAPYDLVIAGATPVKENEFLLHKGEGDRDSKRLLSAQLAQLQYLRPGGTMIVFLKAVESWKNLSLVHLISQFADVHLSKPIKKAASRTSFFLVAKNVRSTSPQALQAIEDWKEIWRSATFDSPERYDQVLLDKSPQVGPVLEEYGEMFVKLALPIWHVHAYGLKRLPYIKKRSLKRPFEPVQFWLEETAALEAAMKPPAATLYSPGSEEAVEPAGPQAEQHVSA